MPICVYVAVVVLRASARVRICVCMPVWVRAVKYDEGVRCGRVLPTRGRVPSDLVRGWGGRRAGAAPPNLSFEGPQQAPGRGRRRRRRDQVRVAARGGGTREGTEGLRPGPPHKPWAEIDRRAGRNSRMNAAARVAAKVSSRAPLEPTVDATPTGSTPPTVRRDSTACSLHPALLDRRCDRPTQIRRGSPTQIRLRPRSGAGGGGAPRSKPGGGGWAVAAVAAAAAGF